MVIDDTVQNREWIKTTVKYCFDIEVSDDDITDVLTHPFNRLMFERTTYRRKWLVFKIVNDFVNTGRLKWSTK